MLAISIFSIIFILIIPMTMHLYENIEKSKKRLHAMITNYDGTIINYNNPLIVNGEFIIEGTTYRWQIKGGAICSSYELQGENWHSCVTYKK